MKPYILVIIDMQPYFECEKQILETCKKEIKKAIDNKNHIIFLEYVDCGVTDNELMLLVIKKGYSNYSIVSKNKNDGSTAIAEQVKSEHVNLSSFRVCGVYTDQCVFDTVRGLLRVFPGCNVEVMKDAVRTRETLIQIEYLDRMQGLTSVVVR